MVPLLSQYPLSTVLTESWGTHLHDGEELCSVRDLLVLGILQGVHIVGQLLFWSIITPHEISYIQGFGFLIDLPGFPASGRQRA